MTYNITKATAPAMPSLGKGTECIRLLLSQTSKDMHEPLVPMLFPILGAHISGTEFQYPDLTWRSRQALALEKGHFGGVRGRVLVGKSGPFGW